MAIIKKDGYTYPGPPKNLVPPSQRKKVFIGPRRSVRWFAREMEIKLRENDDKGGWEECSTAYLLDKLRRELEELRDAEQRYQEAKPGSLDVPDLMKKIQRECADVANYAMMIADNLQGETKC